MSSTTKSGAVAPVVLVVGKPSRFALMRVGIELLPSAIHATKAPYYGPNDPKVYATPADWSDHKDAVKADAVGEATDVLDLMMAHVLSDVPVTIVHAIGACEYGDGVFASVADPDAVLDFIEGASDCANVTVHNVKAESRGLVRSTV